MSKCAKPNAIRKWVLLALALVWLFVIWNNSMQPATISGAHSKFVLAMLQKLWGYLDTFIPVTEGQLRKIAHFSEYTVLGVLLFATVSAFSKKVLRKLPALFLMGLLVPGVDETIQRFSPGRSCELRDALIDFSGVVIGVVVAALVRAVYRKLRRVPLGA